ncbi:hypothetical protein WJU23_18065 [Prosthecobacter sp. SYSU 5D2]|uniref:hypothetical protein n=1 Tax=Prosthecobacter sp. SYSU 5D2 TaxID=3134134 RepID=UPI0031FEB7A1
MTATQSNPDAATAPSLVWDDETVRALNRHMRIRFRYLSSAVRQMTLQQCMEEVSPAEGRDALIAQVEKKLTL